LPSLTSFSFRLLGVTSLLTQTPPSIFYFEKALVVWVWLKVSEK
jgi:hypothetical protein